MRLVLEVVASECHLRESDDVDRGQIFLDVKADPFFGVVQEGPALLNVLFFFQQLWIVLN
jgi:hypothetical protein